MKGIMNSLEILGKHYLDEVQKPSIDSDAWLAYLVLKQVYSTTSYWSYDGYHVHALVDYSRDMLWEDNKITSTDRTVLYKVVSCFSKASTKEIVKEWEGIL